MLALVGACDRPDGRPGLLERPTETRVHGRFSVDGYQRAHVAGGGYHFDILKVDGEPIFMQDTNINGGLNFCEVPGIDAVAVLLGHRDPEIHGTWVLQLQGDVPHWTRLCGKHVGAVKAWDTPIYREPACHGVAYDATTMSVIEVPDSGEQEAGAP